MDNFNENRGSSSTQKVINDENGKSEPKPERNIMHEKFRAFQAGVKPRSQYEYIPKPVFFYGSLTDPSKLREVLQLPNLPLLRPARVRSYKIMLWGQYPALVDGPHNSYVDGMAYVVETEQHVQMLEDYETGVYSLTGIRIEIEGKLVSGRTFMWAEDDLSSLMEGTWSLEEWRRAVEEEMASHFRPVED